MRRVFIAWLFFRLFTYYDYFPLIYFNVLLWRFMLFCAVFWVDYNCKYCYPRLLPTRKARKKVKPELLANRLLIRKHNKDENMNVTNTVLLTFNLFNQIAKKKKPLNTSNYIFNVFLDNLQFTQFQHRSHIAVFSLLWLFSIAENCQQTVNHKPLTVNRKQFPNRKILFTI